MKILLGLSLVLNLVLGCFLLFRKPEKEVVERLIIETHKKKVPVRVLQRPAPNLQNKPNEMKKTEPTPLVGLEASEFQDAGEKMETERLDFLTDKIGMTEEKLKEHNRIREEFFTRTGQMWQKNPMHELSFKERRQMIEMEEELYAKLEKLHGKKNWERYQKFREQYNERGYKKQMEDGVPFIFMGL